jgi:hypothetical protein
MVYLRHPNIVTVMGAVVDQTSEPLLVSVPNSLPKSPNSRQSELTAGKAVSLPSVPVWQHNCLPFALNQRRRLGLVVPVELEATHLTPCDNPFR